MSSNYREKERTKEYLFILICYPCLAQLTSNFDSCLNVKKKEGRRKSARLRACVAPLPVAQVCPVVPPDGVGVFHLAWITCGPF